MDDLIIEHCSRDPLALAGTSQAMCGGGTQKRRSPASLHNAGPRRVGREEDLLVVTARSGDSVNNIVNQTTCIWPDPIGNLGLILAVLARVAAGG